MAPASANVSKPDPADNAAREAYLAALRQAIATAAADTYPYRARRRGLEGDVLLHFRIHPDGRIDAIHVRHSSGYAILDGAALAVIQEELNQHFRPFPPAMGRQPLWVDVPIRYRLR